MKKIFLFLSLFMTGCAIIENSSISNSTSNSSSISSSLEEPKDEIWVITWNGDGRHYKDIGHQNFTPDDLTTLSVAMMYAVAKSYNEHINDSIKINLASYEYEGDTLAAGGLTWSQKRENFKSKYGKYPDIFLSTSLFDDTVAGLTADLSIFTDDAAYNKLNPVLMNKLNYFGLQAGLPQYAIPAGVFVNKELALSQGISIPNPTNWTWNDYTNFTANETITALAKSQAIAGAMSTGMDILKDAYILPQLANGNWEVDFTSMGFRDFLGHLPKQAAASAYGNNMVDARWTWAPFRDGEVLTTAMDPWMIQSVGAKGDSAIKSSSFDIFPRPSFKYHEGSSDEFIIDNHVSASIDPVAIYNYCRDDGDTSCNTDEVNKIHKAWDFLKYWITDTRSWEARFNQQYLSSTDAFANKYYNNTLSESLPVTIGEVYDAQLLYWYQNPNLQPLQNSNKFPGFAEVLRLWENGKIYGGDDKLLPKYYNIPGDSKKHDILDVLTYYSREEIIDCNIQDSVWKDTYFLYLMDNQIVVNKRYQNAFNSIKSALKTYYGWSESSLPN